MVYNILVIDDEDSIFEKYKKVLAEYSNLHVMFAKHGPAAIEMVQKREIHLIFLDQIFSSEEIATENLYWINDSKQIATCNANSNRQNIREHIDNQGIYILQKLRNEGYKNPIIFVTDVADEEDIEKIRIGPKAKSLGADDYLPKSRGLTEINLTKIIKAHLKLSNLRSIRQEISYLIENGIEDKSLIINKTLLIDELVKEATSRRRMGIPFVKEVIKEVRKENYISIGTFSEVLERISNKDEWQFEEINPRELLEWVLSKCDSLKKYKAENWDYEGTNGVRYGYRYSNGNEVFYLRIVHPKFANNIQDADIHSIRNKNPRRDGYFEWVDLDKYKYELESNDPYWQGNHIIIYLEKGNDGSLIKEYVSDKAPLSSNVIKEILEKTKTIICASEPEWHGAISIASIYIKEENIKITISDFPLYNLLNEEGRNAIMGLSLRDKKKRDIQAFGRVADLLVSGVSVESVYILDTEDAYYSFVNQCAKGEWDTTQPIPDSPAHARFIPRGFFRSGLEESFFYIIKTELVNKKCNSIVFINANIKIKETIYDYNLREEIAYYTTKEVDFIILLPNQIYLIDTKGPQIDRLKKALSNMPQETHKFRDILNGIVRNYHTKLKDIIIMSDDDYNSATVQNELNEADKVKVCCISKFCAEIKEKTICDYYDLVLLENKLNEKIFSSHDSPFESKTEFSQRFGKILSTKTRNAYAELHTETYYIRRYSMLHTSNVDDVKYFLQQGIQEHKLSEIIKTYNSGVYFLLPILPDGIIFVDRAGNLIEEYLVKYKSDSDRTKIYVRWIYKFYKKYDKDFEGPLLLKDCIGTIHENEKEKLLYHYFKAIDTLSILQINDNLNIGFDENSLKVFKKGDTYIGVLEPLLNKGIQNDDILRNKVLSIINILNPGSYELQLYKNEVNASRDNLRSIIKKYIDSCEDKDKFDEILTGVNELRTYIKSNEKHGKSKKPENRKNPPNVRTQQPKPMSSVQETTPVGQLQGHQEKKVEAESISIKPPEKQTQGRLEGTIKLLAFSVDFNSVNEEKRREQFRCDFINNIKNGQLVKIGYPKQNSGVYSGMIWILNEQQHNTAKDVQDVTIASEPIMEYGSIVFQGKGYMFRKDAISPEDLKGLHEGGKVSFILNKGDIVKDIKIIPS